VVSYHNAAVVSQSTAIVIRYCTSCLSSVTRVYCDKMTETMITRFLLKKANVSTFSMVNLTTKFDRSGVQTVFDFEAPHVGNGVR